MTLVFEYRRAYGHARYYPVNDEAKAVARANRRICLNEKEVLDLAQAGFRVELIDAATAVRRVV